MKPLKILLALALCCTMAACAQPEPETTAPTEESTEPVITEPEIDRTTITELEMVISEQDFPELDTYPNLKTLDLSGSTCYTAIVVYAQNHPDVDVTFTVDLGGAVPDNWTTELELQPNQYDPELLVRNLVYLPYLQTLHLPKTGMTVEQIAQLREQYPEVNITYSVAVQGKEIPADTTELNLAGLLPGQIDNVAVALRHLDQLEYVELMNEDGTCSLSRGDVRRLVEALPELKIHYVFELFGQTISTSDKKVHFKNLSLSDEDEPAIREALSIMSGCEAFILERCGLSNEKLAEIREDYDNTELVWRVDFGVDNRYSYLTNAEAIRTVYNVTDSTVENIKYCRKAKYIDMGHNEYLSNLSFAAYMPDLEIFIGSESGVTDLSGFANCKKLEFLELAWCMKLEDISPLAECPNLRNLNICYTKVSDLSPLDGIIMEQLFCKKTKVPPEEQQTFKDIHEGCIATFTGKDPYAGPGWRYKDNGRTFTDIYKKVREVFKLDQVDALIKATGAK